MYVHVVFDTDHYNFNNDTAKALAKSVEIALEDNKEAWNKLIGAGHDVTVYEVRIIEQVQTGTFSQKVDS